MTTPAHHCANLLIQGTTEEVHREMLAILQGMYEQDIPSPAGLRAMAAELVRLPVREMTSDGEEIRQQMGRAFISRAFFGPKRTEFIALTTVAPLGRWKP